MIAKRRRGAVAAWAVLLWAGQGVVPARLAQDVPRLLLPADNEAPGWSKDGEPQEFVGEDLYVYINGGAEIYQEYGFRRVIVQDYKNASGKEISLEIYEMETPEAAFGIFTFKKSGEGQPLALGGGAELEDYYLNFWKGRYLVTLTGFDETAETVAGLPALAAAVDSKISDRAEPPGLIAALPGRGLKPGSVRYLRGLLGLNNVYAFHTAKGLGFQAAVKGDYEDGSTLIVLDYGSGGIRVEEAWPQLRAYLDSSDRFKPRPSAPAGPALFLDGRGRYLALALAGPLLRIGLAGSAEAAAARAGSAPGR
jgi:hypothetical protein